MARAARLTRDEESMRDEREGEREVGKAVSNLYHFFTYVKLPTPGGLMFNVQLSHQKRLRNDQRKR